jgi:prepilin-type N-terminal cleavage/methylation domain-containing protein
VISKTSGFTGFTLIELIITIAVIGILATAGVFFIGQSVGIWGQQASSTSLEGALRAVEERITLDLRLAFSAIITYSPTKLTLRLPPTQTTSTTTIVYAINDNSLYRNDLPISSNISSFAPTKPTTDQVKITLEMTKTVAGRTDTKQWDFTVKLRNLTSTSTSTSSPTPSSTTTPTPTPTPSQYTLTVTASPSAGGITTPAPGTYTYDAGTVVTLTANPDTGAGWVFSHWEGALSGSANPATITMDASKNVTAVFQLQQYTLTIAARPTAGGTTTPVPGIYTYDAGTVVTLTASANASYRFDHWDATSTPIDQSTANPASLTMNGNYTVVANFTQQFTLAIAANPTAGGTTTPAPGTYAYDAGTAVTLSATANIGYRFFGWSGDASGTVSPTTLVMNGNKNVTATFIQQWRLTVTSVPSTGGAVTLTPSGGLYDAGTVVTLTASANAGYRFGSWSGDASGTVSPTTIVMNGNKNVTANFIQRFTLTITASPAVGGTTSPTPPGIYTYDTGTVVTLMASANAGYRFNGWTNAVTSTNLTISVTVNADKTVIANFIKQWRLTVTSVPSTGGAVTLTPSGGLYDAGTVVTLTASANAGYRFDHWDATGTTIDQSTANPVNLTMNGDYTVVANFIQQFTLSIAASPTAGGTTTPAPGTYTYDAGTSVTLTALVNAGYRFGSWSGDASGTVSSTTIVMNGNKSVTANFIKQWRLTVTANPSAGGAVTLNPSGGLYDAGTVVTLTASANAGYRFNHWDATGTPIDQSTTNPASLTMNGDYTVVANFIQRFTLTIAASPTGGGTTTPALGTYTYDAGTVVTLTASANASYRFDHWDAMGTPIDQSTANPVSLTMNGNYTVVANFVQLDITLTDPTGGENWGIGYPQTILWSSNFVGGTVKIEISTNGTSGPWTTIIASTPNTGSYAWTVTGPTSTLCRIRITCNETPTATDMSTSNFTIANADITVITPNGGEVWNRWIPKVITWSSNFFGGTVRIDISRDSAGSWTSIIASTPNIGSYTWNVTGPTSTQCLIRVICNETPTARDRSNNNFTIQ